MATQSGLINAIAVFYIYIPSIISLIFLLLIFKRFIALKDVANRNVQKIKWSLAFRIFLLMTLIFCNVASILLNGFIQSILVNHKYLVLLLLIEIITLILQIILMIYEFNKNVPLYYFHKLFWFILLLSIISCFFLQSFQLSVATLANYLFFFLRLGTLVTLNIFSLCIRRQDIHDYENLPFFSTSVPQIQMTSALVDIRNKSSTFASFQENNALGYLNVDISKSWSLVKKNKNVSVEIKMIITSVNSNTVVKVKRTLEEFSTFWYRFSTENHDFFDQNPIEYNEFLSIINQIKQSTSIEQIILLLIRYVQKVTSKIEMATPCVMEFFQIPEEEKIEMQKLRKNKFTVIEDPNQSLRISRGSKVNFEFPVRILEQSEIKSRSISVQTQNKETNKSGFTIEIPEAQNSFSTLQRLQNKAIEVQRKSMMSEVSDPNISKIEDLNKTFNDLNEMNQKDIKKMDVMLSSVRIYK